MDMIEPIRRYLHPKILIVLLLGFSSGLPILMVAGTLNTWLFEFGVKKSEIGAFAFVMIPYTFNFLWAPLIDTLNIPYLTRMMGRRRSWMLVIQVMLLASIMAFTLLDPSDDLIVIALCATLVAFLSASQDVVIDAFRTEYLPKDRYGEGAAMAVFGYRVGLLIAGAGALYLAEYINWNAAYAVVALFMLVGILTTLFVKEPQVERPVFAEQRSTSEWFADTVLQPFKAFMTSHNKWLYVLLFVAFYKMSDGFFGRMANPFFLDSGFSKIEIANVTKIFGLGMTLFGTFLGGVLLSKLGMYRSLFIFAILQLVTNLTYIIVAIVGHEIWALSFAIACDNMVGGMLATAAIAFMMRLCQSEYTATQYALLTSLIGLGSIMMASSAGWVAEHYGWIAMFGMSGMLGLPCIYFLIKLRHEHYLFATSSDDHPEHALQDEEMDAVK